MWIAAQQRADRLCIWVHDGDLLSSAEAFTTPQKSFEEVLIPLIEPYLPTVGLTSVVCAGVASGSFNQVPCALPPASRMACDDPRITLFALPCLTQDRPVDMMQGEEAPLAGFLAEHPGWDGVICLPGPRTRWVHISAGEVVSFRSYMSGELFDLLRDHSTLDAALDGQGWDAAAFDVAVFDAISRPERFSSGLFSLRAGAILKQVRPAEANARLMGTLLGIELAATRPYWLGQRVVLIGQGGVTDHYAAALAAQGVRAPVHGRDRLARLGLEAAYNAL